MCSHPQICLVLLIGVPGCGKTYFQQFLENYFRNNPDSSLGTVGLRSVSYDDYLAVQNPRELERNSKWKSERNKIFKNVEELIVSLKQSTNVQSSSNPCSITTFKNCDKAVIVIDDNMYYKSMRYEYFKLAKHHNLSFAQLFFQITPEEALKCNQSRGKNQLPDEVILRMFAKIEPPDIRNVWESNSVTVLSYADYKHVNILEPIFDCIKTAFKTPVRNREEDHLKLKNESITTSNARHQIDNLLKQLVRECIEKNVKGNNTTNRQAIAKSLSNRRLEILSQIRQGIVTVPFHIKKPASLEQMNCIRPFLINLLNRLFVIYSLYLYNCTIINYLEGTHPMIWYLFIPGSGLEKIYLKSTGRQSGILKRSLHFT